MEGSSTQDSKRDELMAEGRKAMACKEYLQAVNAFQEVCDLMSATYGQVSKEMGEPSYLYGRALLELARVENTLFGGGVPVPQNEEEEDDNEEEGEEEKEGEGEEEGVGEQLSDHTPKEAEVGPSCSVDSGPVDDVAATGEAVAAAAGNQATGDEEPTTLQLAWEMFEVARVIYEESNTLEEKLRLADINLLLGEVSLESDQFERAIDDFTTCLKIRELVLKADDRLLAEIHFQLGLAHTFSLNFDEAVDEYESAKQVLELRKEILQGRLEKVAGEEVAIIKGEISDLDDLLPDIDSKINDVYEIKKKQLEAAIAEDTDEQTVSSTTGDLHQISAQTSDSHVQDISHLIRRKKKVNGSHDPAKPDSHITSTEGDTQSSSSRKRPATEIAADGLSPEEDITCSVEAKKSRVTHCNTEQ